MPTFAELVEKAKKEQAAKRENILKGSGFTKRLGMEATRNVEFEEKKALKETEKKKEFREAIARQHEESERAANVIRIQLPTDIEYDEYQRKAIAEIPNHQFAVLVGAAGTGKTTVTRVIAKTFEAVYRPIDINEAILVKDDLTGEMISLKEKTGKSDFKPPMAFVAFTGRAVQQMKRALPQEYHPLCSTIHSLLGYRPEWFDVIDEKTGDIRTSMRFIPTYDATNKLPHKRIIIDECGMLSVELFNVLRAALTDDCEILFIGDMQQLPPVHGRSILGYAMMTYPTYELKKIHRQAADNPIIKSAWDILRGIKPVRHPGQFDIGRLSNSGGEAFDALMTTVKALYAKGEFDPLVDGIIVPQNKGGLGQIAINEYLCTFFNPERKINGVIVNKRFNIKAGRNNLFFAEGDKVMLLQNDNERGLTNGMIGIIQSINLNGDFDEKRDAGATGISTDTFDIADFGAKLEELKAQTKEEEKEEKTSESQRQASHITMVKFADGQEVMFKTAGQYGRITHAYAFTCHKSQGGEYPTVIILAHSANSIMLSREWLYTAVTRARERVILLTNDRGLESALRNQRVRGTTLEQKIKNFVQWAEEAKDEQIPNLAPPKQLRGLVPVAS